MPQEPLNKRRNHQPEGIPIPEKSKYSFPPGIFGDLVALLPSIRHMGGGHIVIGERSHTGTGPGYCRESMRGARYEAIKPLLEAQIYVKSVSWGECPSGAFDMAAFRHTPAIAGENIAAWQARHLTIHDVSLSKWLYVHDPIPSPAVFARSPRYHNPRFPWPGFCDKYPDAVFVGSVAEHEAFCLYSGHKVPHRKTADFLELARVMAGAERVIANQTAAWWCAAGLDRPLVQETCPDLAIQNSIIERDQFFYTGNQDQSGRKNWR